MTTSTDTEPRAERAREQRARRRAHQLGLDIAKSRRDGSYMIVDPWSNTVVAGGHGHCGCEYGLWLDDVERALDG